MGTELLPERCVEHRVSETEVLGRLKVIEDDVRELYNQLKDKVDSVTLKDLMDRNTKEIEELRKAIMRLSTADIKHCEALAGIHQILLGFKDTQDLMRKDYCKLSECYTQTSVHIASITAILAERAKKDDSPTKEVIVQEAPATMWGVIKAAITHKIVIYALVLLIAAIVFVLIGNQDKILEILRGTVNK